MVVRKTVIGNPLELDELFKETLRQWLVQDIKALRGFKSAGGASVIVFFSFPFSLI